MLPEYRKKSDISRLSLFDRRVQLASLLFEGDWEKIFQKITRTLGEFYAATDEVAK